MLHTKGKKSQREIYFKTLNLIFVLGEHTLIDSCHVLNVVFAMCMFLDCVGLGCVCVCVCVRACMRACVRACACVCVRVFQLIYKNVSFQLMFKYQYHKS